MFARFNLPHAKGAIFLNPWTAYRFARQYGFPLVIKPNVSGFSRGSHFPINNFQQLWKAAFWVKIWWPTSVVEQYLLGANYRVLATPDKMISVIRRYAPFVDGNGSDSISQLISSENLQRQKMGLHPTIYPIKKSSAVIKYLKTQQLTLDSVPAKNLRIYLNNRVALAPGGVVEIIDQSTIPDANRELFLDVVKHFDARLFGIDVIFEQGIEQDYRKQRCILLEVNSRPYTRMHSKPRYGNVENLEAFYTQMDALPVADIDTY